MLFFGRTCTVFCWLDWLDTFETDRKGERASIAGGCLRAAGTSGFGLPVVDFGDFEALGLFPDRGLLVGFGLLVEGFGVLVFLVLSGIGDRNLDGALGVRGPFGVGGSRLTK